MAWALTQRRVTEPAARFVLVCLGNYADANGCNSFPSLATLKADTGLSERTIHRSLKLLLLSSTIFVGNQGIAAAHIQRPDRRPTVYNLAM